MSDDDKTFEHQPDYLQRFDLTDMDIPDISHMPAAKNKEQLYIPADEDWEEREIEWIHLSSCPVPKKNGGVLQKRRFSKSQSLVHAWSPQHVLVSHAASPEQQESPAVALRRL